MVVATNLLEIFWKLIRHFKARTFLQIIWYISYALVNLSYFFSSIENGNKYNKEHFHHLLFYCFD